MGLHLLTLILATIPFVLGQHQPFIGCLNGARNEAAWTTEITTGQTGCTASHFYSSALASF